MPNNLLTADITLEGQNDLSLYRMKGHEELGRPFMYEVDLFSPKKLSANAILGKTMIISIRLDDHSPRLSRKYTGIVTEFKYYGTLDKGVGDHQYIYYYRAVLRPELWLLTLTSRCRIFQNMKVTEVISQVLEENDIDFKKLSFESKIKAEYCIQYRESDFNFISRLMEQEGIYYYFRDDKDNMPNSNKLILTESMNSHQYVQNYGTMGCSHGDIYELQCNYGIALSKYSLDDYDFEESKKVISGQAREAKSTNQGQQYDYLAGYNHKNNSSALNEYAKIRLEESQTESAVVRGKCTVAVITAGMLFDLQGDDVPLDFVKSVVSSIDFLIQQSPDRSGNIISIPFENKSGPSGEESEHVSAFDCSFTAIPVEQQFRPRRITPVPLIQGTQTATVTDDCDQYGRVKVKFHWDDKATSCWVRVSQPMAGKKWGWISLPRAGQEVIVSFEEGNPNRPIITGRVYNNENMPPYTLPEDRSQSGIKTNSYEGSGFNELRFEDKQGKEEIYLHAQKDLKCEILNDEKREVKNDRTVTIINGNDSLKVEQGKCIIEAMTSIELKVGTNSIKIDQQGITIKGMMVTVKGETTLDAKSPMTTVSADGCLTLKGGITKIN